MNRATTRVSLALGWSTALLVLLSVGTARAQVSSGRMEGKVLDAVTKQPQADVVVTATSPALQGEQTVVSDAAGEFEFPVLPSGTYLVHLEKEGYKPLNQDGLVIHIDKTIRVVLDLPPEKMVAQEIVVVGKPPTVDVGSTQTGTTITSDFLNNMPVDNPNSGFGNRSFESLATTAPGANSDGTGGVSIAGASSPENNYTIDGVNVTDPTFGLLGSALSIDFVKEVDVITGGYNAEYGRATGGVENVVTKSGGNEFHGSFRLDVMPGTQAPQKLVIPFGSAVSSQGHQDLVGDIGAEVGGYIVKDKLWFYAGIEPTVEQVSLSRSLNEVTYQQGCPVYGPGPTGGAPVITSYSASNQNCSASLKGNAVDASGNPLVAGTSPIGGTLTNQHNTTVTTQYIAKLTYLLNQNQTFTLSAFGNPGTSDGPPLTGQNTLSLAQIANNVANESQSVSNLHETSNVGDYSLRWDGAFFDKHLLATASFGLHHQETTSTPQNQAELADPNVLWANTHSLAQFDPSVGQYCGNDLGLGVGNNAGTGFYKCPVLNYATGGPGFLDDTTLNNYQGKIALTNLFRAAGHHEVKYGLDYNLIDWTHVKEYTGQFALQENAGSPGTFYDSRGYGYLVGPNMPVIQNSVTSKSRTTDLAGFIQDSYRVLDLFTLNVGVRWEDQQMFQADGTNVINLPNEVMPRIGLIYDWTGQGRSKVYADYAVFYEDIPLDIIDRGYPAERQIGAYRNNSPYSPCNPLVQSQAEGICNQAGSLAGNWGATGSAVEPIDPNLGGQNITEVEMGAEYEVFEDARAGVVYTHRNYNQVMEDMSTDGANTYFIANPGQGLAASLPTAQRDYDAATVYLNKTFSHHWMLQASYTLSRLYGNYSGLIQYEYAQLDPNITSAFDLPQLIKNQTGPLPNDHTHQIKVYVARDIPVTGSSSVTLGLGYTGLSGAPENYAGGDQLYGPGAVLILPRGSAGRLPWTHEVDASLKYNYRLTDSNVLTASVDIFNLLDLQQVTQVDSNYTFSYVSPIVGGTTASLANLKTVVPLNGPVAVNPDFNHPTAYQAPLTARFGVKLTF